MEEKKKSNLKKIITAIIIIAAVISFYIWYSSGKEDSLSFVAPAGVAAVSGADAESISENGEIIKLLSTLRGINLDAEFLNSELFQSLHEVSIQLPPAQPGRVNPFSSF